MDALAPDAAVSRSDRWLWAICALPVAQLLLFVAFVVRARLALGDWPEPYRPDPKDLGFDVHHVAVIVGMQVAFLSPLLVLGLLAVRRWGGARRFAVALPLVVFVATYVTMLWLARMDPGRFVEWFMD